MATILGGAMDDDWFRRWVRQIQEVEAAMRSVEGMMQHHEAVERVLEHQFLLDQAMDAARIAAAQAEKHEDLVQQLIGGAFQAQAEIEQTHRAYLDALRMEELFRGQEHLQQLVEAAARSRSMVEASLAAVDTLRPSAVEALEWQRALEEVRRQLDLSEEEEAEEAPGDADQNLVKQIILLVWAIFGFLSRVSFAIQFVTSGQHSLVPQWAAPDSPQATPQEVVEIFESGPVHTVTCRAVMRVGPNVDEQALHGLDPGDTVRVYDPEGDWVRAICTETWYSGWVFRRHLRNQEIP